MSFLKDLPKSERKKILANLSKEDKDKILDLLARYLFEKEEREKRLKELLKI